MPWFDILQAPADCSKTPPINNDILIYDDSVYQWKPSQISVVGDTRYLKLDCSNRPLTDDLSIDHAGGVNMFYFRSGASEGMTLRTDANRDQAQIGLNGNIGRQLILCEDDYKNNDFDHATQADPTLFIHSATDPDSDNTQYLQLYHDTIQGYILSGKNALNFGSATLTTTGTLGAGVGTLTSLNLTADANQIVLNSDGGIAAMTLSGISTVSAKTITFPDFTGTLYISGGTDVTVADGGTGRSVTTAYMPITGGTTTTAAMQSVATGIIYYPLCYNTNATLPTWQILDVRGGGTGRATLTTAYGLLAAGTTATGATQTLGAGTSGQYLISGGAAAVPSWTWGVIQTKTGNYTMLMTDDYCLASGANVTITLPTAASVGGKTFSIKNINADNTLLTVATTSSQTIDGSTTWKSNTPNEALLVISDGSNWRIF